MIPGNGSRGRAIIGFSRELQVKVGISVNAHLCVAGVFTLALAVPSTEAASQSPVLAPIDAMFHGMTKRDPEAIKAAALPGTILVLMRDGNRNR